MQSITLTQSESLKKLEMLRHEIIEDTMALWDALSNAQFTLEQFDARMDSLHTEKCLLESQIGQLQKELSF